MGRKRKENISENTNIVSDANFDEVLAEFAKENGIKKKSIIHSVTYETTMKSENAFKKKENAQSSRDNYKKERLTQIKNLVLESDVYKNANDFEKNKLDVGKILALYAAGWNIEDIAADTKIGIPLVKITLQTRNTLGKGKG